MKKETDEKIELTPYTIGVRHLRKTLSIDAVLTTVFSNDIHEIQKNEEPEVVNELFLLELAYGIHGIGTYNPKQCDSVAPDIVKEKVKKLMMLYPLHAEAAHIFLNHFETATEALGKTGPKKFPLRTLTRIKPEPSETPLSFFTKTNHAENINAIVHDIRLLHLNHFMKLMHDTVLFGIAIPEENCVIESYNLFYKLIKSDILSSPKHSKKKIKIYLRVVHDLIENPEIADLLSGSLISLVLSAVKNDCLNKDDDLYKEIDKLDVFFSPAGNFKLVRLKMSKTLCIPHYFVISKDLAILKDTDIFNQLGLLGKLYHSLFNTYNALQTHIQDKPIFYPKYLTDLPVILKNADAILEKYAEIKTAEIIKKNKRLSTRMSLNLSLSTARDSNSTDTINSPLSKRKHRVLSENSSDTKKEELQNKSQITESQTAPLTDPIPNNEEKKRGFRKRSSTFSDHSVHKPRKEKSLSVSPLLYTSQPNSNNNNNMIEEKPNVTSLQKTVNTDDTPTETLEKSNMLERKVSPNASSRRLAYTNSRGQGQLNPNGFFEPAALSLHINTEDTVEKIEKKGLS